MAAWQTRYVEARARLARGDFAGAARIFSVIATQAPDLRLRAHAAELGTLASYWAAQDVVLMPRTTIPTVEPRKDVRTIDELAILYTNTLVWGAGFGLTVGFAAEDSIAAYIAPGLGMAAAGAGAVALLDNVGGPMRYGVPASITSGLYIGINEAVYMSFLIGELADVQGGSPAVILGPAWAVATAGAITGGLVGHNLGTTPGRASFVGSGALWGGFLTSFVATGAAADARSPLVYTGVAGLVGTNVGLVTTALLASRFSPSIARVRFIDLSTFGGGLVVGGIYASAASEHFDARTFFLLTAAGAASGLALGVLTTSRMERDEPRRAGDPRSAWLSVTPTLQPIRGGALAGAAGTF